MSTSAATESLVGINHLPRIAPHHITRALEVTRVEGADFRNNEMARLQAGNVFWALLVNAYRASTTHFVTAGMPEAALDGILLSCGVVRGMAHEGLINPVQITELRVHNTTAAGRHAVIGWEKDAPADYDVMPMVRKQLTSEAADAYQRIRPGATRISCWAGLTLSLTNL